MVDAFDLIRRFIPHHVQEKLQDRIVDMLTDAYSDERWRRLMRSYRSDAEFRASFTQALERAVQRLAHEYEDQELVDAVTRSTRFWDVPSVQSALREMIQRPSSYLESEYHVVEHSFIDVLPTVEAERVRRLVHFFLNCLIEEIITIPQLAPLYQVQFHKISLEHGRRMVAALQELQRDQRLWMHALLETLTQSPILPAVPSRPDKGVIEASVVSIEQTTSSAGKQIEQPDYASASQRQARPEKDWGEAPDITVFFGRVEELSTLEQWIIREQCRLVAIVGLRGIGKTQLSVKLGKGGIGKTDLSLKLAQGIQHEFEYVIWRRLLNAPKATDIIADLIKFLSNQQEINLPETIDGRISRLLYYLRQHRCLLM